MKKCIDIMKIKMTNPWKEIKLDDYEGHMSLDSVKQLQTLNIMMKDQLAAFPVNTAMILGIAGGNGIEHVSKDKYKTVYGVDINEEYLKAAATRYADMSDVMRYLCLDLNTEHDKLPQAQLLIANLLIEYIGYDVLKKVVRQVGAQYVSCIIQNNTDEENWVSDSPYLHAFDGLDAVHFQMDDEKLSEIMDKLGYKIITKKLEALPNGKALLRLDYVKGLV